MNITLNIEAGNPGELHEAITGLAGIMGSPVIPQAEPEKRKQSSKGTTKQEKQPDPEPTVESKAEEKPDETPDAEPETTEETSDAETETAEIPTVVDLRAAAQAKGGTPEGKKAIKALLDKFESKSISDVPEDKRTAFLQALEDLG